MSIQRVFPPKHALNNPTVITNTKKFIRNFALLQYVRQHTKTLPLASSKRVAVSVNTVMICKYLHNTQMYFV